MSCGSSRAISGRVTMRSALRLRFDYGSIVPWMRRVGRATEWPSPAPTRSGCAASPQVQHLGRGLRHLLRVHRHRGREGRLRPHLAPVARAAPRADRPVPGAGEQRSRDWQAWSARCALRGPVPGRGAALADHPEGAHLRAHRRHRRRRHHLPAGGDRRRAQLGLPLLLAARLHPHPRRAARPAATWRRRRPGGTGCCARSPATRRDLQIMYGLSGERRLPEFELPWLPGYEGSAPVRIGNDGRPSSSSSTCTAR